MNTMADLRREVASRLRNSLHGREIDMMEHTVEIPHMLGVTPIGKIHDPQNEKLTLLDPQHQFWKNYDDDIRTKRAATEEIETAIRSLKKDGILRKTYPYGEEAEVVYVEVDKLADTEDRGRIECLNCEALVPYSLSLELKKEGTYAVQTTIDCNECDFSRSYGRSLVRQ